MAESSSDDARTTPSSDTSVIQAAVIYRPELTDRVISMLVGPGFEGTRAVSFHAPSGMGKTRLLAQIADMVQSLPGAAARFPLVSLNFASLSGSVHDVGPEFYRQYRGLTGRRLPRFELVWNELQRTRGAVSSIDPRRKPVAEIEPDGIELAGSVVDAVGAIPFVGVATGAAKLALRLGHDAADRRRLSEPRAWLDTELGKLPAPSPMPGADADRLERLISPAIAADIAAAERSTGKPAGTQPTPSCLVMLMDTYESVSAGFGLAPDRTTVPYLLAESLRDHGISALMVIAGQVPLRWDVGGEAGPHWRESFTEIEVPLLDRESSLGYLADRRISHEPLAAEVERLTRGCPALLAAVADVIQDEDSSAAWQSVNDVRDELSAKNPADPEWQAVFMDWYVKRLYGRLQARDAHEFKVAVAGAALRTFNAALVGVLLPGESGILQAFEALSRYSFFGEVSVPTATGPMRRSQRLYRLHDLVRTAITTSDLYRDDIAVHHQRAVSHYGGMIDGGEFGRLRDDDQRRALAEWLYHLTSLNPEEGLAKAESVFRALIPIHDVTACDFIVDAIGDAPLVDRIHQARLCVLDSQRHRARAQYSRALDLLVRARSTSGGDSSPSRLDVDITRNLAECFRLAGRFRESYEAWDALWSTAESARDSGVRYFAAEGRLRSRIDHDDLRDAALFGRQAKQFLAELHHSPSELYPELAGQAILLRAAHLERQLARIARFSGNYVEARAHAEAACRGYEDLGDSYHRAWALVAVGHSLRVAGEYERALDCAAEARRVFEGGSVAGHRGDSDPLGVSKTLQLRLLVLLALLQQTVPEYGRDGPPAGDPPRIEPPRGQRRESVAESGCEGFDEAADLLHRMNEDVSVDFFGPMYAHYALGQRARWAAADGGRTAAQVCRSHLQSAIALCEKIDGRVERAFAHLGLADLERGEGNAGARRRARRHALSALVDGEISDYPWIVFHAAALLALVDDDLADRWMSLAYASAARLHHPRQFSPFEAILEDLTQGGPIRRGAPMPMVTP